MLSNCGQYTRVGYAIVHHFDHYRILTKIALRACAVPVTRLSRVVYESAWDASQAHQRAGERE